MILVCGASGLLGREICNYFNNNNISYIGTYNTVKQTNSVFVDFSSINNIDNLFLEYKPTICINCIAKRYTDICERQWDLTYLTNVNIASFLAKTCDKYNVHLIHISTDYIFDGENGPFSPFSEVNPLQHYGITKLIAEKRVIANCKTWTIIRVPVLYSDNLKFLEENSVTGITKKIINSLEIFKEDNFYIRRPLFIKDLVPFIIDIIENKITGIKHFYDPNNKITKYLIGQCIAKLLNKPFTLLPINHKPDNIDRPYDTNLEDSSYDINKYNFTNIEEALKICIKPLYYPNNLQNTLVLLDLDGTLIDTDKIHYDCYYKAIKNLVDDENNYSEILMSFTFAKFDEIINTVGMDVFLINSFHNDHIARIKDDKIKLLYTTTNNDVEFLPGAIDLILYIYNNKINHSVVTNASNNTVIHFKKLLPILNKLSNWVTRDMYNIPKPNNQCYEIAKKLYGKDDQYIIGIENTLSGLNALDGITTCKFLITNKNTYAYTYNTKDIYIINTLKSIRFDN